jgi:diguanylate cyclase (GGDEF)-like protein
VPLTRKTSRHRLRKRRPPLLLVALVVVLLAAIHTVDARTGSAPFQHLYYVPIVLAGIELPPYGGVAAAVAAVVLYHVGNPRLLTFMYGEADIVQIALFVGIGLVTARLVEDARRLYHLAETDDLTGLLNLRGFEARLAPAIADARDRKGPLAIMVLDVDRLKSLNDAHGHLTGADAVRTVGQLVRRQFDEPSFACRFGGDEFVVAMPAHAADAAAAANALRLAVHAMSPILAGVRFPAQTLSISVGVAACPDVSQSAADAVDEGETLFRVADEALYAAKSAGRNQVCARTVRSPATIRSTV